MYRKGFSLNSEISLNLRLNCVWLCIRSELKMAAPPLRISEGQGERQVANGWIPRLIFLNSLNVRNLQKACAFGNLSFNV